METKNIVIIIVLILLIGVGVWFWMGGKKAISPGEEAVTPEEEAGLSLAEILGRAKDVASFKYDMVATTPGEAAVTTKIWWKGKKMRTEGTLEGKSMVYLLDMSEQLAYMYFPAENTAMKIDFGKAQETVGESPTEQSESVMKYNPVTVGTEVLDGKTCSVIEYTTETGEVKMWIWTKYGLPIRTELTTAKGTSVIELKNIEFGDISDSMFELPAGVQIMEMPFGF